MLSRLGVGHILYAGNNSALSSPSNNTDDWGWEVCLWLNEGQQLREGEWVRTRTRVCDGLWTCLLRPFHFVSVHGVGRPPHAMG